MSDYQQMFEVIEVLFPDTQKGEKQLLANGMVCFSPYVSEKTGYIMKAMRFLQKRRNEAIFACMCEIRDLCAEAEIPYVFLKGLCLAAQLYDPPEMRIFDDVDVLVSAKDCRQLIRKCLNAGFSFEGEASDNSDAPYMRIRNGHMHAEVLYKEYDTGSGKIKIPLEIHVSPNERCYEMYGRILEDNGYTEEVLARARPITMKIRGETEETFMIPGTEDNIYIQFLHMMMHLALDQVLYLYVDKPWQSQSVLKQALDLLLFAEKERPDWKAVEKLAAEQGHLEEYRCAVGILNRIWGTDIAIEERKPTEDSLYSRPIDFVCRILERIGIQTIMGNDGRLKKAIDHEICEWIRGQRDTLQEGMKVSRGEEGITISVDTEIVQPGKYAVTLYTATNEGRWKIQDYMLELSEEELTLYQSDGYRMIWAPETYGKVPIQQVSMPYGRMVYSKPQLKFEIVTIPTSIVQAPQANLLISIDGFKIIDCMVFETIVM